MASGELVLFPSLEAAVIGPDRYRLTRKFVDGLEAWASRWPGPFSVVMRPTEQLTDDLDGVEVGAETDAFRLVVTEDYASVHQPPPGSVWVGMLGFRQNHLPKLARQRGIAFVTTSEYTLKTRLQIARATEASRAKRLRRSVWEVEQEAANLLGVSASAGIQCNGLPTWRQYRYLQPDAHLYFDTRARRDMVIDAESLGAKRDRLRSGAPLRLGFSGRLNEMKGADHLVPVARTLHARGVPFELHVAGDGVLRPRLEAEAADLDGRVRWVGVKDFERELVPWLRNEVDLFVMPHRQGDPSCTYMETLAGGVPIVGYDNEACSSFVEHFDVGASSTLDDPEALAEVIAELHRDRPRLDRWAARAAEVARNGCFESMMQARVEHLQEISSRPGPSPVGRWWRRRPSRT